VRLTRLEMKNFGPYKGEVKIDFKATENRNLWIVWGTNGSGKTHILKALLWCLYGCDPTGSRKKQFGTERDAWDFVYGAYIEDQPLPEPYMHVNLFFEVDSKESKKTIQYIAKRSVSPRSQNPMNPTQIKCDFEVIKDGRPSDSPREEIEALLPLAASQFFMFHGEEIRAMSQKHAEETHKAIELILEAETFRHGREDLNFVSREIDDDLDDERRKTGGMDDLLDLKKRLNERVQSLETECISCKHDIAEKNRELAEVDEGLKRNEESKTSQEKIDQFNEKLKANEEERNKILDRRGDLINDLPGKIILPELKKILTEKEERHKRREEQRKSIQELRGRLQLTEEVSQIGEKCRLCGRVITAEEKKHIEEERKSYQEEISKLEASLEEEDPTYYEIRETIAGIQGSDMNFEQFKKDLRQNALRHDEIESTLQDAKGKLSESKVREVRNLMERKEKLLTEKGATEQRLSNFTDDLKEIRERLEHTLKMIESKEKHDNVKGLLEKQYDLATRCVSAFESVLNRLSDVRRRSIANHATEVFRELTNKPMEYDRIEIDEQFNVAVMDKHSNVVHREDLSTGERLVVALSFILGLKQASEKVAPLVLDTFFAHLDEEHFGNIIKALPKFADQIVLILTNLEYKNLKEMAPSSFFKHVAQTFQTARDTAELKSKITLSKEMD
jgi:DNA sulfur modification protein DndD